MNACLVTVKLHQTLSHLQTHKVPCCVSILPWRENLDTLLTLKAVEWCTKPKMFFCITCAMFSPYKMSTMNILLARRLLQVEPSATLNGNKAHKDFKNVISLKKKKKEAKCGSWEARKIGFHCLRHFFHVSRVTHKGEI